MGPELHTFPVPPSMDTMAIEKPCRKRLVLPLTITSFASPVQSRLLKAARKAASVEKGGRAERSATASLASALVATAA